MDKEIFLRNVALKKAERVELSLISEVKKYTKHADTMYKAIEHSASALDISHIEDEIKRLKGNIKDFTEYNKTSQQVINNGNGLLQALEQDANELGIGVKDIKDYVKLEDSLGVLTRSLSVSKKVLAQAKKIIK